MLSTNSSTKRFNVKQSSGSLSKHFLNNYQSIFTEIIDESLSRISYLDSTEIKDRIKKMAGYYTLEKKPILGEFFLYANELLQDVQDYNDVKIHQAYVLACALEMGASYFLFVDDMEDDGKTRYGKPCWHLLPDVGPLTWNDSCMLRSFIQELLSQNFPQSICFRIIEYINKIYFLSTVGQHVDLTLTEKQNYENFTMDQYRSMSELKISAIQAPIILALILTNKLTDDSLRQVQSVWNDICIFIQVKAIEYYTLERVPVQGQLTVYAYESLKDNNITDESRHQINTLAWCVEMFQSYYLIMDDIEDEAKTRNGKPCWHLLPNVGYLALNDASLMRSFIYEVLRQNLSDEMHTKMCKLFNEAHLRSEYGQYLDSITSKVGNFSKYNMQLYTNISDNKFTFYTIKFPILVALTMANKLNGTSLKNVDNAMKHIGCWVQMHHDILDWCDELSTGKSNIDIKKGKCSWLAVTALDRCEPLQREMFLARYGSDKTQDVEQILELYETLGLRDAFCQDHLARLDNIAKQIDDLPSNSVPSPTFFRDYVDKIYPFVVYFPEALEYSRQKIK